MHLGRDTGGIPGEDSDFIALIPAQKAYLNLEENKNLRTGLLSDVDDGDSTRPLKHSVPPARLAYR